MLAIPPQWNRQPILDQRGMFHDIDVHDRYLKLAIDHMNNPDSIRFSSKNLRGTADDGYSTRAAYTVRVEDGSDCEDDKQG